MRVKFLAAAMWLASTVAFAEYPEKPVNFVVPWPPGDLEDQLTRMIADEFSERYNVASAVINKPGGSGGPFPGAISVATSQADGYTVGSFVMEVPIIGPHIGIAELTTDTFVPVGSFLTYPFVVVTSKDAPYSTIQEMAEYSQENSLVLGHFGNELVPTSMTYAMAKRENVKFASDAAFDALDCNTLASGDADVINSTLQLLLPCLDKIKVLVAFTKEPISLVPDAPTLASMHPDLHIELWNGLFVPKGTPDSAVKILAEVARETVLGEQGKELAARTGAFVYWQDAEKTAARIVSDGETINAINADLAQ